MSHALIFPAVPGAWPRLRSHQRQAGDRPAPRGLNEAFHSPDREGSGEWKAFCCAPVARRPSSSARPRQPRDPSGSRGNPSVWAARNVPASGVILPGKRRRGPHPAAPCAPFRRDPPPPLRANQPRTRSPGCSRESPVQPVVLFPGPFRLPQTGCYTMGLARNGPCMTYRICHTRSRIRAGSNPSWPRDQGREAARRLGPPGAAWGRRLLRPRGRGRRSGTVPGSPKPGGTRRGTRGEISRAARPAVRGRGAAAADHRDR